MFLSTTVSSVRCIAVSIALLTVFSSNVNAQGAGVVRTVSPRLAATLADGIRTSPTVRALVDELALSDLIVYVLGAPVHQNRRIAGTLRFVHRVGGRRHVRITVDERLPHDWRVAILAHELQHAVEVARAPSVVDVPSFGLLYRSIGRHSCRCDHGSCYETRDAQRTEAQVLKEMRTVVAADTGGGGR